jgi:hypothetical protein
MSTKQPKQRNLSPEQKRSASYINTQLLIWKQQEPLVRPRLSLAAISELISEHYQYPTHRITAPGLAAWLYGDNIPDEESAYALAHFFGSDMSETYAAFGHAYEPPMDFALFCARVDQMSEEEGWEDREWMLTQLQNAVAWDRVQEPVPWWIGVARLALHAKTPIRERAGQIAHVAEAFGSREDEVPFAREH